ncbi:hypothetical protein EV424DRAFT_1345255 [Suillus variegatus]|nr:hypothetical protein EV424DRAFT_1345255 [Suillus variegatus]
MPPEKFYSSPTLSLSRNSTVLHSAPYCDGVCLPVHGQQFAIGCTNSKSVVGKKKELVASGELAHSLCENMTDTNDSSVIPNGVIDPEQDNTLRALAATSGYLN